MFIRILGSAAGGGVPQWNCRCPNCAAARAGSPEVRPRTQSSVAVSADGKAWFLLNVSPDIRQQILAFPALGPAEDQGERSTPIAGCIFTDAELDHTTGLLSLREGMRYCIYCTTTVRRWLTRYLPIAPILESFSRVHWCDLSINESRELYLPGGSASGLQLRAYEVDPHLPRFVREDRAAAAGSVIVLEIEDTQTGGRLIYAPCVAWLRGPWERAAQHAHAVLLDGTFWDDDEPMRCGVGGETAGAMGHLCVSGPAGSLGWMAKLPARHRVYVHINNTNPMLNERGSEHQLVTSRGVRVGADGDYYEL